MAEYVVPAPAVSAVPFLWYVAQHQLVEFGAGLYWCSVRVRVQADDPAGLQLGNVEDGLVTTSGVGRQAHQLTLWGARRRRHVCMPLSIGRGASVFRIPGDADVQGSRLESARRSHGVDPCSAGLQGTPESDCGSRCSHGHERSCSDL